jgi:hypothetical protein
MFLSVLFDFGDGFEDDLFPQPVATMAAQQIAVTPTFKVIIARCIQHYCTLRASMQA